MEIYLYDQNMWVCVYVCLKLDKRNASDKEEEYWWREVNLKFIQKITEMREEIQRERERKRIKIDYIALAYIKYSVKRDKIAQSWYHLMKIERDHLNLQIYAQWTNRPNTHREYAQSESESKTHNKDETRTEIN